MAHAKPIVVLGAGPIGLLAALRAKHLGMSVEVYADRFPRIVDAPRVESVPAQIIALLVEFSVRPARIGVDELLEERVTQWSTSTALSARTPPVAHVGRPALDVALLEAALRGGISIREAPASVLKQIQEQSHDRGAISLLDATGRAAATAVRKYKPSLPLVSRLFLVPMRQELRRAGLMIASGPDGYAYRLANATTLTLGVVGQKDFVRGDSKGILERVAAFAPWLVENISSEQTEPGPSGAASVQWSAGSDRPALRIGDAAFARDALSSQGLAIGFSDALEAVNALFREQEGSIPSAEKKRRSIALHCRRVRKLIQESTFSSAQPWREYSSFLAVHAAQPWQHTPEP